MKYEALVKEIKETTYRFEYDSSDVETIEKNSALEQMSDNYGKSETVGYPVSHFEVVSISEKTDRKTKLVADLFNELCFRGGKRYLWHYCDRDHITFSLSGVDFVLRRLADLLQLSASVKEECIKLITYPEWRWDRNLETEIMNDCDLIIKMILEEKDGI